ncbi:phospholipase D-like domain-containing protein [Viridibacterium curvum]|uniref:phospholipase D n=1 Tax=Viridibacterium curvum TaxID=1101404 RepID=A0ABP9QYN2_9RHOO
MRQAAQSPELALLEASIADDRLSDEERRSLTALLSEALPLEECLRRARNRAFDIVQARLGAGDDASTLLRWLEGVMRAIDAAREPAAAVRSEAFFSPGEACLQTILSQLRLARQSIDVCVFTISDDRISDALLAAYQRGVSLRIITDDDKASDEGSDVARLRESGIAVRVDRTPAHMHHKFAIIDQRVLLNGSYNWTRSAARLNEENLVLSTDARLLSAFSQQFSNLWRDLA